MKRVLVTMTLGVVGAILLAAIINFFILPPFQVPSL